MTEVIGAFRGLVLGGHVSASRATGALEDLADLPVTLTSARGLVADVWALRHNLTAYDATYVALAGRIGCPLVTCDARIARAAVPGVTVRAVE